MMPSPPFTAIATVEALCRPWHTSQAMISTLKKITAVLAACVLAASCASAPPPAAALPELTFSHLTPFNLAVAQVEVASEAHASLKAPHIESTAPVAPEKAVRQWAAHRLKAAGGNGVGRLVITAASLTETPLTVRQGLKGAFYKEQSVRYEVEVSAVLHIHDGGGASIGRAEAGAKRSRTVREDASINDRRRVQFDLVEAAMADFDKEMEKAVGTHLGRWLR